MSNKLDSKVPEGDIREKWDNHRFNTKLVNPANKRKYKIIVVGTGLAGGSACASLSELGYEVEAFCIQDIVLFILIISKGEQRFGGRYN